MRLRKPILFAAGAMIVALANTQFWKPASYAGQLVRVQAAQELGQLDSRILDEPLEIQGALLDYSANKPLVLKAWIALSKYPAKTREILLRYGAAPEFQQVLLDYGEAVIPVIQYFREHDVWSIKAMDAATRAGTLETRHDLGEEISAGDAFWAGLDVAVVAIPLKMLRAGKAVARSGEGLSLTSRTRLFAPRLVAKAKRFQGLGKYGAAAATIYIVITHPSLLNSLFAEAANLLGLSPWLVQFVGWTLLIIVVLYPITWLLKVSARATLYGIGWLEHSRRRSA